jgi:hypothetical protein
VRRHEDSRFDVGSSNPLADLSHVIGECSGTPNRYNALQDLSFAIQDVRDVVPADRGDTQEFRNLMDEACGALGAAHHRSMQASEWESVDRVLAAMVPDFSRDETEGDRKDLVKAVTGALVQVHILAGGTLGAWKRAHDGEVKRRNGQERARGLMKLIVRAWREETDGRKARSLRGAKDWNIDTHAPSRMPTDCLSTAMSRMGPRMPRMVTAAQERRLWSETMATELKCEGGGGRLPISRSAIPAGSQARMLLTYIRLVEGGRLKARREASTDGARNRLAA